jgi:glycosyltransferase involved in cell wall biosynthesis
LKILFVHQNYPGQFLYLGPAMAQRGHECLALTDSTNKRPAHIPVSHYTHDGLKVDPAQTRLGRNYTTMSDRGVTVARAAIKLRDEHGYTPDVIFGHSGWGETLFLKEVWPQAKLIVYAEFYYRGVGADVGFDTEFNPRSFDQVMIAQGRTAHLGQAVLHADAAVSPTQWQASTYPDALRERVNVIFDGVNTQLLQPNLAAHLTLPNGQTLHAGDEVLTFVNRNLEPYRGYHIFMRALPAIMAARPQAQIVIVGGDGVSYGNAPKGDKPWKDVFLDEVAGQIDPARVHFLGRVPYPQFVSLMQISRVHAYLTYPFVLSWSMVEAMAAGALIVGSDTAPVTEMIRHGENGLLVDFFDVAAWSDTLTDALAHPAKYAHLGAAARAHVVANYDLLSVCLPRMIAHVEGFGPPDDPVIGAEG